MPENETNRIKRHMSKGDAIVGSYGGMDMVLGIQDGSKPPVYPGASGVMSVQYNGRPPQQ